MAHQCNQGSCSTTNSSSSSQGGCGCGCSCNCSSCKCKCGSSQCGSHGECKFSEELLHLADTAWMEVLKEKIKEEIRQNCNEQLTQLAKVVSCANHQRWSHKMSEKHAIEDFENQVKSVMCSQKKQ